MTFSILIRLAYPNIKFNTTSEAKDFFFVTIIFIWRFTHITLTKKHTHCGIIGKSSFPFFCLSNSDKEARALICWHKQITIKKTQKQQFLQVDWISRKPITFVVGSFLESRCKCWATSLSKSYNQSTKMREIGKQVCRIKRRGGQDIPKREQQSLRLTEKYRT